jgi:Xaa-Pro aminopeptidase
VVDPRVAAELPVRRARLVAALEVEGIEAVFVPPSADLEYLTGIRRDLPSFGEIAYSHGWVTGAFLLPGAEPLYVLPRMFVTFHLGDSEPGETVVVGESADSTARFREATGRLDRARRIAVAARTSARTTLELQQAVPGATIVDGSAILAGLRQVKSEVELDLMATAAGIACDAMDAVAPLVVPGVTMRDLAEAVDHALRANGARCTSFPTHVFTWNGHDSDAQAADRGIAAGECVLFDFGAVHEGYCSDFGRTICCGEPPDGYANAYAAMLAAQEAGRAALVPGALARDVNAACRAPIDDAGLGSAFRHRMGHGIGLDVHERPFLSPEDDTPLLRGMTFTDEPSLLLDGRFGVRIEDVVVCEPAGGRALHPYPHGPFP